VETPLDVKYSRPEIDRPGRHSQRSKKPRGPRGFFREDGSDSKTLRVF
jgi:hypothetical protein